MFHSRQSRGQSAALPLATFEVGLARFVRLLMQRCTHAKARVLQPCKQPECTKTVRRWITDSLTRLNAAGNGPSGPCPCANYNVIITGTDGPETWLAKHRCALRPTRTICVHKRHPCFQCAADTASCRSSKPSSPNAITAGSRATHACKPEWQARVPQRSCLSWLRSSDRPSRGSHRPDDTPASSKRGHALPPAGAPAKRARGALAAAPLITHGFQRVVKLAASSVIAMEEAEASAGQRYSSKVW